MPREAPAAGDFLALASFTLLFLLGIQSHAANYASEFISGNVKTPGNSAN